MPSSTCASNAQFNLRAPSGRGTVVSGRTKGGVGRCRGSTPGGADNSRGLSVAARPVDGSVHASALPRAVGVRARSPPSDLGQPLSYNACRFEPGNPSQLPAPLCPGAAQRVDGRSPPWLHSAHVGTPPSERARPRRLRRRLGDCGRPTRRACGTRAPCDMPPLVTGRFVRQLSSRRMAHGSPSVIWEALCITPSVISSST